MICIMNTSVLCTCSVLSIMKVKTELWRSKELEQCIGMANSKFIVAYSMVSTHFCLAKGKMTRRCRRRKIKILEDVKKTTRSLWRSKRCWENWQHWRIEFRTWDRPAVRITRKNLSYEFRYSQLVYIK